MNSQRSHHKQRCGAVEKATQSVCQILSNVDKVRLVCTQGILSTVTVTYCSLFFHLVLLDSTVTWCSAARATSPRDQ